MGAPSRFTIASRSTVASGRPDDVMARTADSGWPAPAMSTPSWSRTFAPLDQIVTAPPPAVTFGPLVEDGDVVSVAQKSAGGRDAAHARTDNEDPGFQCDAPP